MKTSQSAVTGVRGNRAGGPTTGPTDSDATTRERVIGSILEHGPSTAAALAERMALTPAAIRRHLDVLVDRGLLQPREQRVYGARGRGRPARVFALTDAGRADFHHAYDDLAIEVLEYLSETGGSDAVRAFAERRIAGAEEGYREALAAADDVPGRTRAQTLAEALSSDGFVASAQPAVTGEQLCQHHCPVAHVAERFPELCEAETEAFARVLGVHVQRLATIAHGDGVCTTHVPGPTTGRGGPRPSPARPGGAAAPTRAAPGGAAPARPVPERPAPDARTQTTRPDPSQREARG